jgi:chromosome segregation ATPase
MSEDTTRNLPGGDLGEVLSLLRSIDTRLTNVENRLTALEDKVERRLHDTRPIWEQVLVRLTAVEERLTSVETRLGKVADAVDSLGRKFRVFNEDILKLQNTHEDLEERVKRMEAEHTR